MTDHDEVTTEQAEDTPPIDVLAPWGDDGPPPADAWRADIMGPGFESRTLALLPDDEGECVATLVRYLPADDPQAYEGATATPRFVALYVHGRNDYFFQHELARNVAAWGGSFYALDLRKYGRSLRPHQTIGFITDLADYDEDVSEALDLIRSEVPDLPLVLIGHSTGGLILTMWTYRHPGVISGLILNSAWLEMQSAASMRSTIQPVLGRIASRNPHWELPMGTGPDHYGRSLGGGWAESGFDLPEELTGHENDPAVTGWDFAREWKRPESYPVPVGWMDTIMAAHGQIEKEATIEAPILSMVSHATYFGEEWTEEVFSTDVVLDVEAIVDRSARLGPQVTIARFDGVHDLFLSAPAVRAQVWDTMRRWVGAFI